MLIYGKTFLSAINISHAIPTWDGEAEDNDNDRITIESTKHFFSKEWKSLKGIQKTRKKSILKAIFVGRQHKNGMSKTCRREIEIKTAEMKMRLHKSVDLIMKYNECKRANNERNIQSNFGHSFIKFSGKNSSE